MSSKLARELLAAALILATAISQLDATCDRTFLSPELADSQQQQQQQQQVVVEPFEAPSRPTGKPFKILANQQDGKLLISSTNISDPDSAQPMKPMHCVYKFIGNPEERVSLNFSSFRLRGSEPECSNEYVDIFIKFKPDDNLNHSIGGQSPNGRFCTTIMPRRLISLHNIIVLIIYSDLAGPNAAASASSSSSRKPLFTGTYSFIRSNRQLSDTQIGPPEGSSLCTHTIYSSNRREGEFQSVTYPGVYVKGLRCSYKFIGEAGQRIRLEFLDLDLFSGGSHCPLDSVRIFDGLEESDPIINTICGSHRSLIVYSSRESLLVTFSTLQREAEIQNRGFSAYFEFSDRFVDPSFIQGNNVRHIRGSECDQRIISQKATVGRIRAPDPRHHANAICRYIFEGLQTALDFERVLLKFSEFDLKTSRGQPSSSAAPATTTQRPGASLLMSQLPGANQSAVQIDGALGSALMAGLGNSAGNSSNGNSSEQCSDNYVRLYTGEQKADQKQDPNDYDYVFCGNEIPQSIDSDAASLLMEYNSGSLGGHFEAEYSFMVDFRIPGIQASAECDYVYKSDHLRTGTFNSPRHPSWYINDVNCTYTFLTRRDEALLLQFSIFKMANTFNEKVLGYNEACRGEDSVEIWELTLDSSEQRIVNQTELSTYCGTTTPGPILSYKPMRIHFKTNKEHHHYGFSAIYNFHSMNDLKSNEFVTNCGGLVVASQRLRTGKIGSPETYRSETYEKRNHICSWNITARPSHRIGLDFNRFELEGSPLVRGCITASVRLNLGGSRQSSLTELCGTLQPSNASAHQYVSESEWLSVTFISTKQASGSNGFTATWTEIKSSKG